MGRAHEGGTAAVNFQPPPRGKIVTGSEVSVQAPPPDDAGAAPRAQPTQPVITGHLAVVGGYAASCPDADLGAFWSWMQALSFFFFGVNVASFSADAQVAFQVLVDVMLNAQAELAAKIQCLAEAAPPERSSCARELQDRLTSYVREIFTALGEVVGSAHGEDRDRGLAAYKALADVLEPGASSHEKSFQELADDEEPPQARRLVTVKLFQSTEQRRLAVDVELRVDDFKKVLVQDLGFPRAVKLIGRTGASGTLVTLKATDGLPEDDEVLLHGVGTLHPARELPLLPELKSLELRSWTFRGVIPRVTNEQALAMCIELKAGYSAPEFQARLTQIQREHATNAGRPSVAKTNKLAELAMSVQKDVLPRYGFEATAKGVMTMRHETRVMFATDPALSLIIRDINALLGLKDDTRGLQVEFLHAKRFDADNEREWKKHLAEQGYVVLRGVVSPDEVKDASNLLWDFIEASDEGENINRHNVKSWQDSDKKNFGWPAGRDDGIIHDRGIGQSEVMWYIRGLPRVQRIFASIWESDKLVASFDGCGTFRPFGHNENWKTRKKHWYHVDQAHNKRGLHCIQGQVTFTDVNESSGGLVVVPGSHKFHGDLLSNYDHSDWDYIALRKMDRVLLEGGGGPRLLGASAGDVVLWDSRTIHCNTLPLKEHPMHKGEALIRVAAYVCMTPAAWCSQDTLQRRQKAVDEQVTTSHWPHEYHEMEKPDKPKRRFFNLSEDQLRVLAPSTAGNATGGAGLPPGLPSLMPMRRFTVVQDEAEVLKVPTTEWHRRIGLLYRGVSVSGYVFGSASGSLWLRLSDEDARDKVIVADGKAPKDLVPGEERWALVTLGTDLPAVLELAEGEDDDLELIF